MLKRSLLCGLAAASMLLGANAVAEAAVAGPSFGATPAARSAITPVRWVCGPYRCAYIPRYRGRVVVHPYMRHWRPPPSPHCNYVRGPRGRWALVCP
jgi:hypothetical protein